MSDERKITAEHREGWHIDIRHGDRRIARFQYGDTFRPHWHPICLPDGRCITLAQPHDHVWHSGLYHCVKFVDDVSLWEPELHQRRNENPQAIRLDAEHHGQGDYGWMKTELAEVIEGSPPAVRASVQWRTSTGQVLGEERQTWRIHPPSPDATSFVMDLELRLSARDQARRLWSGKHGYGGLSWRAPRSMDRGTIINDRGETLPHDPANGPARWVDYTGAIDGLGEPMDTGRRIGAARHDDVNRFAGVAVMSHPGNVSSSFFTLGVFGFIAAHVGFPRPIVLHPDHPLTLRYAVLFHAWPGDVERIEAVYARFLGRTTENSNEPKAT